MDSQAVKRSVQSALKSLFVREGPVRTWARMCERVRFLPAMSVVWRICVSGRLLLGCL